MAAPRGNSRALTRPVRLSIARWTTRSSASTDAGAAAPVAPSAVGAGAGDPVFPGRATRRLRGRGRPRRGSPALSGRPRTPARSGALDLLHAAARAAVSKKARDPVGLDLRDLDGVCDYFLIVSASSEV